VADLIASGTSWFEDQRKKFLSVDAEWRPANSMFGRTVKATIGATKWEGMDAAGQIIRLDTKAFFVGIDEVPDSPRVGDRIIHHENGKRLTYEVIKPSLSDNCWSWADRSQKTRRIHANLVSAD